MNLSSVLISITLINYFTNTFVNGQKNSDKKISENSDENYIDNEIDMKITFRSSIEKFFQVLRTMFKNDSQTSDSESNNFVVIMMTLLPDALKNVLMLRSDRQRKQKKRVQIERRKFGEMLNNYRYDFHAIYPGTLWCGGGNVASKNDDLGVFSQTDICCREHDSCPYSIEAGKTFGSLKNNGMFARSACSCDLKFYKCLKKVNTIVSINIGTTYFNILRPQCFGYSYPIKSCVKYDKIRRSNRKCIKYKFDASKNKTLEWLDVPDF